MSKIQHCCIFPGHIAVEQFSDVIFAYNYVMTPFECRNCTSVEFYKAKELDMTNGNQIVTCFWRTDMIRRERKYVDLVRRKIKIL